MQRVDTDRGSLRPDDMPTLPGATTTGPSTPTPPGPTSTDSTSTAAVGTGMLTLTVEPDDGYGPSTS